MKKIIAALAAFILIPTFSFAHFEGTFFDENGQINSMCSTFENVKNKLTKLGYKKHKSFNVSIPIKTDDIGKSWLEIWEREDGSWILMRLQNLTFNDGTEKSVACYMESTLGVTG